MAAYTLLPMQVADESDWMAKHFFSGGTMPSATLLHFFQVHPSITDKNGPVQALILHPHELI